MATASKSMEIVEVEQQTGVTLQLSMEEASVLLVVCDRIGGPPGLGNPRGAMDRIAKALREADVDKAILRVRDSDQRIIFAGRE